jgi:sugar phosphate isomerase/epimerase
MVGDDRQRDAEVESAARFYETASERFGTTIVNTFAGELHNPDKSVPYSEYHRQGSAVATEQQWRWAIDGFKKLAQRIEPLGMKLAFETHMGYLHDLPEPAKKLVDGIASPAVGVLLDYANMSLFPKIPTVSKVIEMLGNRIMTVHLKNLKVLPGGGHIAVGLADGDINNREMLRSLKSAGYNGPICIEAPRPGDREWFAREDLAYLQSLLKDLNW